MWLHCKEQISIIYLPECIIKWMHLCKCCLMFPVFHLAEFKCWNKQQQLLFPSTLFVPIQQQTIVLFFNPLWVCSAIICCSVSIYCPFVAGGLWSGCKRSHAWARHVVGVYAGNNDWCWWRSCLSSPAAAAAHWEAEESSPFLPEQTQETQEAWSCPALLTFSPPLYRTI